MWHWYSIDFFLVYSTLVLQPRKRKEINKLESYLFYPIHIKYIIIANLHNCPVECSHSGHNWSSKMLKKLGKVNNSLLLAQKVFKFRSVWLKFQRSFPYSLLSLLKKKRRKFVSEFTVWSNEHEVLFEGNTSQNGVSKCDYSWSAKVIPSRSTDWSFVCVNICSMAWSILCFLAWINNWFTYDI